jgi:hypothetical protein
MNLTAELDCLRDARLLVPELQTTHAGVSGTIFLTDDDVLERWTRVRHEKHFSADVDVARFLLSW